MREKIADTVALALVYLIPMHFRFWRSTNEDIHSLRFSFQWFGYTLVFGFTWADITDMYRDHTKQEK
jgi:hypothetical protein